MILSKIHNRGKTQFHLKGRIDLRTVEELVPTEDAEVAGRYASAKSRGFPFGFEFWLALEGTRV